MARSRTRAVVTKRPKIVTFGRPDRSESTAATTARARAGTPVRAGGIARPVGAAGRPLAGRLPVAGTTLAGEADVSGALAALAPSFGDVLASIGLGVAASQAALDRGVIDTVRALADTPITVVSEVIEQLDDNGLPDVARTQLVTQDVSVLNFVTPTVHEWKRVAVQMDMEVSALDSERGITVNSSSTSTGIGNFGVLFGLIGVGYFVSSSEDRSIQSDSDKEAQFSQGRVQMDAVLGPRRTGKFPVPLAVTIGPQIFIAQGAVAEELAGGVVTRRSIDVQITVRKANGAVNPNVNLVLDAAGLLPSFSATGGFTGGTTNAQGRCLVTLAREIPNPAFSRASPRKCTVELGDIRQTFQVTI